MVTDPNFHMVVEDVFSIRNRGTVVTGKIDNGVLKIGDKIKVWGAGGEKITTVSAIETFRKKIKVAKLGDTVGILLRDISKDDVKRGDAITGPDSDFVFNP
jgi:elongation factor Tu